MISDRHRPAVHQAGEAATEPVLLPVAAVARGVDLHRARLPGRVGAHVSAGQVRTEPLLDTAATWLSRVLRFYRSVHSLPSGFCHCVYCAICCPSEEKHNGF